MTEVSENTQAILLLTAPLLMGRKSDPAPILTLSQYNELARGLWGKRLTPQDLLGPNYEDIVQDLAGVADWARVGKLLRRGLLLAQALTEWSKRSIWVMSRADRSYPSRIKSRLKRLAPPVLYGCGDVRLLDAGGLAVVGSRKISDELKEYSARIGAMTAEAGLPLVSGAARGIDRSAMGGALDHGGRATGIMAAGLGDEVINRSNREALHDGRLVLVSAYDPSASFHVGHAMQRNKLIYATADAGLVVTSEFNKGGTWTGAIEQLKKCHFGPVFVRQSPDGGTGNRELLQRGGQEWPEPANGSDLQKIIQAGLADQETEPVQAELKLSVNDRTPTAGEEDK